MSINVNSENSVLGGGSFYRLKQPLQSPGDIFEIDSSAAVVYVGPDSDLTEYRLYYYDSQQQTQIQSADISVGAPFVGSLPALLDTKVTTTGQKARLLVSPVDLYDPNYEAAIILPPLGLPVPPGLGQTIHVPPVVDLIFSFTPDIAALPNGRADRTIRLQNIEFAGDTGAERTDIFIPCYGRRQIVVDVVQDFNAANTANVSLSTVTFDSGGFFSSVRGNVYTFPTVGGTISGVQQERVVLRASQQWRNLGGGGAGGGLPTPTVDIVGTFDYLVVSVRGDNGPATPGYLDRLYVQLSDREA